MPTRVVLLQKLAIALVLLRRFQCRVKGHDMEPDLFSDPVHYTCRRCGLVVP